MLNLVAKEIRVRYMGATLGFAWSLGNPLMVSLTYFVVFTYIFPSSEDRFPLHLVTGVLHWMLVAQILPQSCDWLIQNANLIRKIRFPRILMPAAGVLTVCSFWLAALAVYAALFTLLGGEAAMALLAYPMFLAFYLAFIIGLGLALSVGQVLFRDLKHIVDVLLPLLFWLTPIVWTAGSLPREVASLLYLNPLMPFFDSFDAILRQGRLPESGVILAASVIGCSTLALGLAIFSQQADGLVERL